MRRVERHEQKEGIAILTGVILQESQRLALEQVGAVGALVLLRALFVAIHAVNAVALVGVVVDAGVDQAVEVIEAPRSGQVTLQNSQVPFSVNTTDISLLA